MTAPTVTPRTSRLWSSASTWWSEIKRIPMKQTSVNTTEMLAVGRYRRRRSGTRQTAIATVTAQPAATAPITHACSERRTSYQPPDRARSRPSSVKRSLALLARPIAMRRSSATCREPEYSGQSLRSLVLLLCHSDAEQDRCCARHCIQDGHKCCGVHPGQHGVQEDTDVGLLSDRLCGGFSETGATSVLRLSQRARGFDCACVRDVFIRGNYDLVSSRMATLRECGRDILRPIRLLCVPSNATV